MHLVQGLFYTIKHFKQQKPLQVELATNIRWGNVFVLEEDKRGKGSPGGFLTSQGYTIQEGDATRKPTPWEERGQLEPPFYYPRKPATKLGLPIIQHASLCPFIKYILKYSSPFASFRDFIQNSVCYYTEMFFPPGPSVLQQKNINELYI